MPRLLLAMLVCFASLASLQAENWPNWRGPAYNGVAAGNGFPVEWSSSKNVRWKTKLPGPGASTPVVWGEHIYLTCGIDGKNAVVCLDRAGKIAWQTTLDAEKAGKHKKATGSNPSCVTDGQHVYAYFKTGTLACLDLAGKVVWQQNLQSLYGEDTLWWDLGTSPVLTKQFVIVAVMHSGPSYLAAFDKSTGKQIWKQDRNLDAPSEAAQSYSTPVVVEHGGRELIVTLGADHVTGHDATTGAELWKVGGLNPTGHQYFRSIASPVIVGDLVIAPYGRGKSVTAIRLGGSGDVTKSHVVWTAEDVGTDVPSPTVLNGQVVILADKGEIRGFDLKTGEVVSKGATEKNRLAFSASPVVAGGKLYVTREDGKTFVLEPGAELKLVASNDLDGEFVAATPVFANGQVLIRTIEHLYCVGQ